MLATIAGEIGYFLHVGENQMKKQDVPKAPATTTLNIRGPVGAVLTGDGAVANVNQGVGLSAQDVARLVQDLRSVLAELPEASRDEVIELVDVIEQETASAQPSTSRLRGALQKLSGWLATANEAKNVVVNALPLVRSLLALLPSPAGPS